MGQGCLQKILECGHQQALLDPDQVIQREKVALIGQVAGHLLECLQCTFSKPAGPQQLLDVKKLLLDFLRTIQLPDFPGQTLAHTSQIENGLVPNAV